MSLILVVDDSYDLRVMVEAVLRGAGHTVISANDGEAGLQAAMRDKPELILTDFQMPRLDGFGLLNAVRSDAKTASVPVIMLTAYNRREMLVKALRAGVDDFLGKPFKKEQLLQVVADVLKNTSPATDAATAAIQLLSAPPAPPASGGKRTSGTVMSCELRLEPVAAVLGGEVGRLLSRFYFDVRDALRPHGGRVLWFARDRFLAVFDENSRTHQGNHAARALHGALLVVLAAQRTKSWASRRFPGREIPELAIGLGLEAGPIDEFVGSANSSVIGGRTVDVANFLGKSARALGWSIVVPKDAVARGFEFVAGRSATARKPDGTLEVVEVAGLPGTSTQVYALAEAAIERNSTLLRSARPQGAAAPAGPGAPAPAAAAAAAAAPPGMRRVIRKLAEDGLVSVALVEAEGSERVLKTIPVDDKKKLAGVTQRVLAGAAITSVVHPVVARVFGQGMNGANACIESEYCPGGDLRNLIAERMVVDEAMKALLRICVGLKAAHEKKVFHGDLTAGNVRIRADGSLAITDFQVAGIVELAVTDSESGVMARSPHYMSPELINGQQPDAQTDLYSLGILLFEMLTGEHPYASTDLSKIMMLHLGKTVPALPEALARFQPLLDKLMAKLREERFGSVQEAITFMAKNKIGV